MVILFLLISSCSRNYNNPCDPKSANYIPNLGNLAITPLYPEMVSISSGSFSMGDALDGMSYALPVHTVNLSGYYIGKYEVTFDEYDAYCNATGKSKPSDSGWGRGRKPVINVSWNDAVDFCNWLSVRKGLEKCYDSNRNLDRTKKGYRLSTEAEWEKAARGGLSGKRYPWGDSIDGSKANYYNGGDGYDNLTAPVGNYPANGYGLYDMAGNVWEWCNDWYQDNYYSSSPSSNPTGAASGTYRVVRGGSSYNFDTLLRCALRYIDFPAYTNSDVGFRVAMTQ